MPGFEIVNGRSLVNFGTYEDITSYLPPSSCPMPENEQLANYVMRLLAVCEQAGIKLSQRDDDSLKGDLQTIADYLRGDFDAKIQSISANQALLSSHIESLQLDVNTSLGLQASFSAAFDSFIEKIVLVQADIAGLKLQIDKLYAENLHVEIEGGIEGLDGVTGLTDKLDEIFMRDAAYPDEQGKQSRIGDIAFELGVYNDDDFVFEVGSTAIWFKTKTVVGG